ncbi:hypothetical protein [Mesorhizobium sophorae]|uniref:hypothetical protein n=1 Tax=Mesorhizobium sophorae TaxID=1300294 RepID=UPI000BA4C481|nr:hypothetical protein [Mesorhizobium sophorae]
MSRERERELARLRQRRCRRRAAKKLLPANVDFPRHHVEWMDEQGMFGAGVDCTDPDVLGRVIGDLAEAHIVHVKNLSRRDPQR